MTEATEKPVPYETLVRLQAAANRAAGCARGLEECVESTDRWIAVQLGCEKVGTDYLEEISEEFHRCVEAREADDLA